MKGIKKESLMKFKFLNQLLFGLSLALASSANAGLITDTSNSSFIDNTTGLEWMDFGINDEYSYNEVKALLSSTFLGWELATQSQVTMLFDNAFSEFSTPINDVYYYADYRNSDSNNKEMLEIFSMMGYSYDDNRGSLGWFEDDQGGLSYAHFYRGAPNDAGSTYQNAHIFGKAIEYGEYRTNINSNYSTMLVRSRVVPEPSTLAIFALGLIGLTSRRLKKNKA